MPRGCCLRRGHSWSFELWFAATRRGSSPGLAHPAFGWCAANLAVEQIAGQLYGLPVVVPDPAEYLALGAARQAAGLLEGIMHLP